MKKLCFCIIALLWLFASYAQETILNFTGLDRDGGYFHFDKVEILNHSQHWQQILYYPDTTMAFGSVGIDNYETRLENVKLFQNTPNPFQGVTDLMLQMEQQEELTLEVYDLNGRKIAEYANRLEEGTHTFRLYLSTPQVYLLSAATQNGSLSIKMVNSGNGGDNRIEYIGLMSKKEIVSDKNMNATQSLPFQIGDSMSYVGYRTIGNELLASAERHQRQWGSEEIGLTFDVAKPQVETGNVGNITRNSVEVSGNSVIDSGGLPVTSRGVCWSTSSGPVLTDDHTENGSGLTDFNASISGLMGGTNYYVRAYATNADGTAYGNQTCFTTKPNKCPTLTTTAVSNVGSTTAVSGGVITDDGGVVVTARGICWSTSQNPTISDSHTTNGSGSGSFTSNMSGLNPGTVYYVRAYASNSVGTGYGNQVSFTTVTYPTVITGNVSNVTWQSAICGGTVTSDGGANVTARGVCWSTSQNPTISSNHTTNGTGTGSFSSSITGLSPNTTYYVRAYATNSAGTAYGSQVSFATAVGPEPCSGATSVTDYDNNTYNTVQIGSQCWMKQNLRTMHYADGTSISLGSSTSTTTAYRYYPGNNSSNVSTYGYLYNWKAVMRNSSSSSSNPSGVQGICPTGWHVPSDAEWTQLTDYVSSRSEYVCGSYNDDIAKALASTAEWSSSSNTCAVGNNPSGNNATGFSALPAGRNIGYYDNFDHGAFFWSVSLGNNSDHASSRNLFYGNAGVGRGSSNKYNGFSVRCLRDEGGSSATLPTVTTTSVTSITHNSATCGGNVTTQGTYSVTARGVCWSTSQNPTINNSHTTNGSGTGSFSSSITGLSPNTTYYVRAYATNSAGTAYGSQKSFTTAAAPIDGQPCPGVATVTDYDNNTYNTVQIGNQCWMKENLKTTRYADGTSISLGSSTSTETAYRYCPDNNSSNVSTYGYLYNWKAVMGNFTSSEANPSGVQGICPTGWHVPSDAEWTQLTTYVKSQPEYVCEGCSGTDDEWNTNCIAKALASTTGWSSDNSTCAVGDNPSANNATGFSAVPASYYIGYYGSFGYDAYFWSATQGNSYTAYSRGLYYNYAYVSRLDGNKRYGFSVRCLRD